MIQCAFCLHRDLEFYRQHPGGQAITIIAGYAVCEAHFQVVEQTTVLHFNETAERIANAEEQIAIQERKQRRERERRGIFS